MTHRRCSLALVLLASLALLVFGCSQTPEGSSPTDGAVEQHPPPDGQPADDAPRPVDGPGEAVPVDTGPPPPDQHAGPWALRVMAANLTSGNLQSYDPGHGARIIEAFQPDVVLIQELSFGDDSPATIAGFIATTLGPDYSYYREAGSIPNGVISRYPIVESGEWDDPEVGNRDFAWARIDLPGPRDLWAVSVHLLTSKQSDRAKEANALVGYLDQHVPADALVVLGGDLNTASRSEGCISTLRARFVIAKPYPVDQDDNGNTNAARSKPYDWVMVSANLAELEVPLVVGQASYPRGLVFDSRIYQPLADLSPVELGDSDASQMQHMAVIRQFSIPAP